MIATAITATADQRTQDTSTTAVDVTTTIMNYNVVVIVAVAPLPLLLLLVVSRQYPTASAPAPNGNGCCWSSGHGTAPTSSDVASTHTCPSDILLPLLLLVVVSGRSLRFRPSIRVPPSPPHGPVPF